MTYQPDLSSLVVEFHDNDSNPECFPPGSSRKVSRLIGDSEFTRKCRALLGVESNVAPVTVEHVEQESPEPYYWAQMDEDYATPLEEIDVITVSCDGRYFSFYNDFYFTGLFSALDAEVTLWEPASNNYRFIGA